MPHSFNEQTSSLLEIEWVVYLWLILLHVFVCLKITSRQSFNLLIKLPKPSSTHWSTNMGCNGSFTLVRHMFWIFFVNISFVRLRNHKVLPPLVCILWWSFALLMEKTKLRDKIITFVLRMGNVTFVWAGAWLENTTLQK